MNGVSTSKTVRTKVKKNLQAAFRLKKIHKCYIIIFVVTKIAYREYFIWKKLKLILLYICLHNAHIYMPMPMPMC